MVVGRDHALVGQVARSGQREITWGRPNTHIGHQAGPGPTRGQSADNVGVWGILMSPEGVSIEGPEQGQANQQCKECGGQARLT